MNRKTLLLIAMIFVFLIVGMMIFGYLKHNELKNQVGFKQLFSEIYAN